MGYRVGLARHHDRDLPRAAALQEKLVAWDRQQAAPALALPPDAPLDAGQRNRIRTLGVSVFTLGQILREQGNADCVQQYEEAIRQDQRIKDTAAEAIVTSTSATPTSPSRHPQPGRSRSRLPAKPGLA